MTDDQTIEQPEKPKRPYRWRLTPEEREELKQKRLEAMKRGLDKAREETRRLKNARKG